MLGAIGCALIVAGHAVVVSEASESVVSALGALAVAAAHLVNRRLCADCRVIDLMQNEDSVDIRKL